MLLQTPQSPLSGSIPVEPGTVCSLGIPLWQVTVSTAASQACLGPQTLPAPLCRPCPASPVLTTRPSTHSCLEPSAAPQTLLGTQAMNPSSGRPRTGFGLLCTAVASCPDPVVLSGAIAHSGRHGQGRQQWQGCGGGMGPSVPVPGRVADGGHHGTDSDPMSCAPPPLGCCHSSHLSSLLYEL